MTPIEGRRFIETDPPVREVTAIEHLEIDEVHLSALPGGSYIRFSRGGEGRKDPSLIGLLCQEASPWAPGMRVRVKIEEIPD